MVLRTTRWSPDTCSCVLEYEWDDAINENERTHKFSGAVHVCEHHKTLVGAEVYDKVLSENTQKNMVLGEVHKIKPDITIDDYTWSFDENRRLKVGFLGKLDIEGKAALLSACNRKFGLGRTEVV